MKASENKIMFIQKEYKILEMLTEIFENTFNVICSQCPLVTLMHVH